MSHAASNDEAEPVGVNFFQTTILPGEALSSDEDCDSSFDSDDSAKIRALEASARLRDYGDSGNKAETASALPPVASIFSEVEGPPSFLDPEATRPLATSIHHGEGTRATGRGGNNRDKWHGPKGRVPPGQDFDISRLAPLAKGQTRHSANKRPDVPDSAVLEGKAKKNKANQGPEATGNYSGAQIAMLGGQVAEPKKHVSTSAMNTSEFLNKGHGAAQLPRKTQDRKDKEKEKRSKGQSTHSHWKSEAEMAMRQQFD